MQVGLSLSLESVAIDVHYILFFYIIIILNCSETMWHSNNSPEFIEQVAFN